MCNRCIVAIYFIFILGGVETCYCCSNVANRQSHFSLIEPALHIKGRNTIMEKLALWWEIAFFCILTKCINLTPNETVIRIVVCFLVKINLVLNKGTNNSC